MSDVPPDFADLTRTAVAAVMSSVDPDDELSKLLLDKITDERSGKLALVAMQAFAQAVLQCAGEFAFRMGTTKRQAMELIAAGYLDAVEKSGWPNTGADWDKP